MLTLLRWRMGQCALVEAKMASYMACHTCTAKMRDGIGGGLW